MKFPRYLELFRSRWWVIVLAGLICAVAAYGVSTRVLKKQYTATETFEVNIPGNQSTTSNSTAPSLVATDSQLLTSYPVAQRAISVLGLTKTVFPDQLTSSTACTPSDLAQTFSCTLTWRDPKLAASLLDKLGQVAIDTNRQNQARVFQPLILQVQQTIKSTKLDLSQAQSQQQSRGASAGLAGRIDTDQVALTNLQQSQISLQQQLAAQSNSIISLNPARPPAGPSSPRPLLDTILAALLGLMIGVGSLLLTDYLDDSPRSPEHLSQELGAPIFASLPRVQRKAGADLEVLANPHSDAAEAYRILRTSIRFANVDAPIHSVLVTSAGVGEGKTTTACNLAVTFAQAGVRVVLIDADLRRPSVHRALHLENSVGLTSVLCAQNDVQWSSVLQPGPVAHLHVLTAGPQPPNPAELLSSRRMRRIMEHLSERADLVIVDAPPLLAVADPAVLSLMTDSALLVTDVEETSLHALQRARESLAAVGASISGIVLNKVPRGKHAYYHYYGEGYYSEAAAFEDASPRLSIEEQAAASGS